MLKHKNAILPIDHRQRGKGLIHRMDSDLNLGPRNWVRAGTIIRAYAPCGHYWRNDMHLQTAIYVNQGDLIFTACHFDEDKHPGDSYSEFDEPMVEEIRLLAALTLPIGINAGMVALYPLWMSARFNRRDSLCEFGVPRQLGERLRMTLSACANHGPWLDGPLPPAFGGSCYDYRDAFAPVELQQRIYGAIDPGDHLLMRGLATLLKAAMLSRHRQFVEEALYSLYISLDASFALVLRMLRKSGIGSPDAYDAQAFIEEAFGDKASGMRYFEEYYEDRIKAIHPESRFGVFPYAPLMHDDFFFLFDGLREVYRFFILGEAIDPRKLPHSGRRSTD